MHGRFASLQEHRWLTALRQGFLLLLPISMLGGLALFLQHLPLVLLPASLGGAFGHDWVRTLDLVCQASLGMLGLCLSLTTSYALATLSVRRGNDGPEPVAAAGVALVCFLILASHDQGMPALGDLGPRGVLLAAFTGLCAGELYLRLARIERLRIRLPGEADPLLPGMLGAILPAMLTVAAFAGAAWLLHLGLQDGGLGSRLVLALFRQVDSELGRALLFDLLNQLLWFVGAHGNHLLEAANSALFIPAAADNALAAQLGQPVPHIVTKTFFDLYVFLGGTGATGGLLLAVLLAGRQADTRKIGWLAAPASLLNINEPLVYGLPVVFNPVFLLPFVGLPLLLTLSAWLAIHAGLVPPTTLASEWTTPMFVNAWQATRSWQALALQAFNLGLAVLIYLPFLRLAEERRRLANASAFRLMLGEMQEMLQYAPQPIAPRQDGVGKLARGLLADLSRDMASGAIHLVYQPRVDHDGRACGVEALLRWQHPQYGAIPPTVVIGLAEDAGRMGELGRWVLDRACAQLAQWRADGVGDLQMAVNLSPLQLADPQWVPWVRRCLARWNLPPQALELEITETRSVANDEQSDASMNALNDLGVSLAMDDFGMGYSSLLYMRRFRIDTIKLDGSLTREVEHNTSCQDIIAYVALLCQSREVRVVAEYIETTAQLAILRDLGCQEFQGYLFSPPLSPEACLAYLRQQAQRFPAAAPTLRPDLVLD